MKLLDASKVLSGHYRDSDFHPVLGTKGGDLLARYLKEGVPGLVGVAEGKALPRIVERVQTIKPDDDFFGLAIWDWIEAQEWEVVLELDEITANNCGIGSGGFQPGNTCAKGGGSGQVDGDFSKFGKGNAEAQLKWAQGLKETKTLGGSTGAVMVQDPTTGQEFIKKYGSSAGQIKSEYMANQMYASAGVPVANTRIYTDDKGQPFTLAEKVNGKPLNEFTGKEREAIDKKIAEDFAIDATLGNWDVIGMSHDNILVTPDGTPYRIDTGGALEYRAQGGPKGNKWNDVNDEIVTMRSSINPSANSVFGKMDDDAVQASFNKHQNNLQNLVDQAPPAMASRIANRMVNGINRSAVAAGKKPAALDPSAGAVSKAEIYSFSKGKLGPTASAALASTSSLNPAPVAAAPASKGPSTPSALAASIQGKDGVKFAGAQKEKFDYLNPNGIQNNTVYFPLANKVKNYPKDVENIAALKAKLPPGTVIKGVYITQGQMSAKPAAGSAAKPAVAAAPISPKSASGKVLTPQQIQANMAALAKQAQANSFPGLTEDSVAKGGKTPAAAAPAAPAAKKYPKEVTYQKTEITNKQQDQSHWTPAQRKTVEAWTGSSYATMRGEYTVHGIAKTQRAKDLDIALRDAPNKVQGQYYRGLKPGAWAKEQAAMIDFVGEGGTWVSGPPTSSSRDPAFAASWGNGGVFLSIKGKSGISVESQSASGQHEREILNPAGLRYKILKIHKDVMVHGTLYPRVVEMEEL